MDYDSLIRNWHLKASDEDYFSKFMFEYLAYIAFLRKKKFRNVNGTEQRVIQMLKADWKVPQIWHTFSKVF